MAANVVFEKAWPIEGRVNVRVGSGSMGEELMSCIRRSSITFRTSSAEEKKKGEEKGKKKLPLN